MGEIRKQTIYSSLVIYVGFAIGFLNTYFYVKNGTFTTEQYGLIRLINDLGITFFSFATFGVITYIYRFFPQYKSLPAKENDQVAFTSTIVLIGFILVCVAAIFLKPVFIRKFSEHSPLLIKYYYWILPFAFGVLYFTVFEAFGWFGQKVILTNFLKETGFRLIQLLLILLFLFRVISFDLLVKLFSCIYILLAAALIYGLYSSGHIRFNFRLSNVTKTYRKQIFNVMALIYGGLIINTVSQYIGAIVIASISKNGLADVGVYTFAAFVASIILVPQKSIIGATIPVLLSSWKSNDMAEIHRVYSRTSINLLLIAMAIFFLIWLNMSDAFVALNINKNYESGRLVILLLGLKAIVDAGTGVNSQVIGTSDYWRFDVYTSILLFALIIPLNYFLVKLYGISGSALGDLIAYTVYNAIRYIFILRKFHLQPFNKKTLYSIVLVTGIYFLTFYLFAGMSPGWGRIVLRSLSFISLFTAITLIFNLTPDARQLFALAQSRLQRLSRNK